MKKVLWILGTAVVCVLYAFFVGIIMQIGNITTSIITHSEVQSFSQDLFNWVMLLGWVVLIVASIIMWKRWNLKCHACKRWGALVLETTKTLKQENISVLVELEHRNLDRRVTGTHDQYIPGKRKTFQDTYKCKYCGSYATGTRTVDGASI